jgi:hypothetical protein
MSQILLPGKNVIKCFVRPVVPGVQLGAGVTSAASTPVAQFSDRQNLIIPQPVLDFTDTVAPHIHGENLLDNMGRFRVGNKMIAVIRVCQIAIRYFPIDTLPTLGLGLFDSPDFLGCIAGVKLIEPIPSVEKKDAGP